MKMLNQYILKLFRVLGYLIVHLHSKVLFFSNKSRDTIIKLLLYPLIWILLRIIKNYKVQLQLYFVLFFNLHIVILVYIILIRLFLILFMNLDVILIDFRCNLNLSTLDIINQNSNEACVGLPYTYVQQNLNTNVKDYNNIILFSTVEDSDFGAANMKYTVHNAYKNYLSYENSRNRFYNRIFNNSFDDSIWAEKSFSHFMSDSNWNYRLRTSIRDDVWRVQVQSEAQSEVQSEAQSEVQSEAQSEVQSEAQLEMALLLDHILVLTEDPELKSIEQDPKADKLHSKLEELLQALELMDNKLLGQGTSLKEVNSDLDEFLTDLQLLKIRANAIASQQNLVNITINQDIFSEYDSDVVSEISESEIEMTQREIQAMSESNLDKVTFDEELDQKAPVYRIFQDKDDVFLSSTDYKRFALILSDNYGHVLFKDIQFLLNDQNDSMSCYCNVKLQKELSKVFPDVNWKDKTRWNLIFSQFLQRLDKNFENTPLDDLLCNSNILTSADLQTWFISKFNGDTSDIGGNAYYDDDEDSIWRSKESQTFSEIVSEAAKRQADLESATSNLLTSEEEEQLLQGRKRSSKKAASAFKKWVVNQ